MDGADVTAASTITDTPTGVRVEYGLAGAPLGSPHTAHLEFKDTAGAAGSADWAWKNSPYSEDNLFIEAEDYNTDSGNYLPSNPTSGAPFNQKSMYDTLSAVHDTDYHNNGNPEADNYRLGDVPNMGIANIASDANVRGAGPRLGFDVQNDWKIGWNDQGDWFNYTRNFPNGVYNVYARLSSGGGDRHAHLDMVTDATIPDPQTKALLGRFDAPTTGGWDTFSFVPLLDAAGALSRVALGGVQTVRFTTDPGNFDYNYLMLVPAPAVAPRFTSITRIAPTPQFPLGGVTLTWENAGGGCRLEVADKVTGPWVDVGPAVSPLSAPIDRTKRFARIRCP